MASTARISSASSFLALTGLGAFAATAARTITVASSIPAAHLRFFILFLSQRLNSAPSDPLKSTLRNRCRDKVAVSLCNSPHNRKPARRDSLKGTVIREDQLKTTPPAPLSAAPAVALKEQAMADLTP